MIILRKIFPAFLLLFFLSCGSLRQGSSFQQASASGWEEIQTREIGYVEPPAARKDTVSSVVAPKAPAQQPSSSPAEEPKELSDQVIAYARTFTGVPYKLGASGPKQFDCSGFTRYVFKHFGYELTQYSGAQFQQGREVPSYANLQKGDLVFFGKRGSVRNIGHVGIVVSVDEERGAFRFIHASTSGGVMESESTQAYYLMRYIGARRILPDEPPRH